MLTHNNNYTKEFKAGLYLRLSREDGEGQSESITNQKDFLEKYAIENGYAIVDVYIEACGII